DLLAGLAWDVGARFALVPPLSRDLLPEVVTGLMRRGGRDTLPAAAGAPPGGTNGPCPVGAAAPVSGAAGAAAAPRPRGWPGGCPGCRGRTTASFAVCAYWSVPPTHCTWTGRRPRTNNKAHPDARVGFAVSRLTPGSAVGRRGDAGLA